MFNIQEQWKFLPITHKKFDLLSDIFVSCNSFAINRKTRKHSSRMRTDRVVTRMRSDRVATRPTVKRMTHASDCGR